MKIEEINIYPVKSLGGIQVNNSIVRDKGLEFDRRWLLVNERNEFLTQRNFGLLATLKVEIGANGFLISNQKSQIEIPFQPSTNAAATVKIWSSRVRADFYGDTINDWFSDVLETNCRLVSMPEAANRKVNYFYAVRKENTVSFADAMPYLLAGENSLNDLNEKLDAPIPMNRFRPNFIVSGSAPFEEDEWKRIKIGATIFHVVKPCARCNVTTIDQTTGISTGVEPLKTLATFRIPKRSVKRKVLFGQYLIAENPGSEIRVGDAVEVLETKS